MIWEKAKEVLRDEFSESVFNLWIDPLKSFEDEEGCLKLCCPDRYFSAYVSRNYLEMIREKIHQLNPMITAVSIAVENEAVKKPQKSKSTQLRLPHVPEGKSVHRSLHPRYTFDHFMVGESNILAQSACRSISLADDTVGPCLYINSNTGLGKSHLTHAVAHHILAHSPMTRLHYLTAQQFSFEMVNSIKTGAMDNFKQKYHNHCDILLVEDVHSLTGKKKTQEELNELLDAMVKSGKRVVLTANKSPRDLQGIDEEFRSRMTAGLVTSIQAPDLTTRTRIVQNKVQQHNLELDQDGIDYIAQHIKGDVRKVESAILGIRAKAQLNEGVVSPSIIEQVITSIVGTPQGLSPAAIREFICKQYNVCTRELKSRSRKKKLTFPRQVAMYLCRKHTENSLADIGKEFNRDHSTVLHSIKKVTDLSNRNISIEEQINLLSKKLNSY